MSLDSSAVGEEERKTDKAQHDQGNEDTSDRIPDESNELLSEKDELKKKEGGVGDED